MGLHFRHWTRKCIFLTALHGYLVKSCYMTGCLVHLKNVWIHPPKREITWGLNKNTVICVLNDKLGFTRIYEYFGTVKNKQTN